MAGNRPNPAVNTGAAIVDGTVCGKPFHGAMRDVTHFPTLGQFNGTSTTFGPFGSINVDFRGTATINPDHSASLRGTSTTTGGTGIYKGATGSGAFTGTQPANSPVTTQHVTGRVTY